MAIDLSPFIENTARLPSIPRVVTRVVTLAQQGEIDMQNIADLVASDPALAAKTLQYANSPIYANDHKIENLRRAIVLLGLNTTVNLALSFSLTSSIKASQSSGLHYPLFWRRSLLAASAALELGRLSGERALEELFLAGLLQDIGMIAIDRLQPEFYSELQSDQVFHQRVREYEIERMGGDHAEAGSWLCKHWGLADRTTLAIANSHRPTVFAKGDRDGLFVRCVALSGVVADYLIFGESSDARNQLVLQCQRVLDFNLNKIERLIEVMHDKIPEMEVLFDVKLTESASQSKLLEEANATLAAINIETLQRNLHKPTTKEKTSTSTKLSREERYDPQTKVFSRKFADGYIPDAFDIACRTDRNISFMLLEIGNLKEIHKKVPDADAYINDVARALEATVRSGDVLSRFSDELFLIIIGGATRAQATMVCQRIYDAIETLSTPSKKGPLGGVSNISIHASIGVATHGGEGEFNSAEDLLNAAQSALFTAKLKPTNRIAEFDQE
ncbi:MAG: HDOD domain-containing protein [Zhongshania sp.]|uniref:sensor domain-containing diguanylate cyclase n=1 Tax=Zhongshania sp. TaxID=1971902 RepID=UPI002634ADE2|nr:HDOD domain-containing protein [Zhongshania sp.]MDF1693501.1 HDOD domain-containing protein [Zhongshania sp.]